MARVNTKDERSTIGLKFPATFRVAICIASVRREKSSKFLLCANR